jgi:hypothetical protein
LEETIPPGGENQSMVQSNPDEFKHSKHGAICYNTVVDFAHSGATVLVEIVTSQEKSQASLINIARQAINKTGGFTKSFTQSTEWIPSRIERICRFCKQSFIPKKSFAKYCGNACRVKAYQWRNKVGGGVRAQTKLMGEEQESNQK